MLWTRKTITRDQAIVLGATASDNYAVLKVYTGIPEVRWVFFHNRSWAEITADNHPTSTLGLWAIRDA